MIMFFMKQIRLFKSIRYAINGTLTVDTFHSEQPIRADSTPRVLEQDNDKFQRLIAELTNLLEGAPSRRSRAPFRFSP